MELTSQQNLLFDFVKQCHSEQVRKYTHDPYWHHLYSVAETVSNHMPIAGAIEIALCHDLIEDTECDIRALVNRLKIIGYGGRLNHLICRGVHMLTDVYTKEAYPGLNRMERKTKEAARLGKVSHIAQSIKYADLIDNTKSIVENDPKFALVYLREKIDILNKMRQGNMSLFIKCCYTLQRGLNDLNGLSDE